MTQIPGEYRFMHGDAVECHNEPPTCGCTEVVDVPAREVRPGDRVLDGEEFVVHDAMTTGKKAQTTSLRPLTGSPRHYTPGETLTIERRVR